MTSVIAAGIRPRLQLPAERTAVVTLISFLLKGLLSKVKTEEKRKSQPCNDSPDVVGRTTLNIGLTADLGNPGLGGYGLRDGERGIPWAKGGSGGEGTRGFRCLRSDNPPPSDQLVIGCG